MYLFAVVVACFSFAAIVPHLALSMDDVESRQGVKPAGQKGQAGVGGGVGGTMEDRTSSQFLVVELANTVIILQLLVLQSSALLWSHRITSVTFF